jgi:hypothetical protein
VYVTFFSPIDNKTDRRGNEMIEINQFRLHLVGMKSIDKVFPESAIHFIRTKTYIINTEGQGENKQIIFIEQKNDYS